MADEDMHEQIGRLETRLEELADGAERCRKIGLFAKALIAVGVLVLSVIVVGLVSFNPTAAIGAMAALIGGIVLLGANASTFNQTMADMQAAEAQRSDLIGRIEPRPVHGMAPSGARSFPPAMNGYGTRISMGGGAASTE
jgi:hypothetical protein